ncbi:MAG: acyl-CoA synthetase, partial [Acidimicrobiales bacterium]
VLAIVQLEERARMSVGADLVEELLEFCRPRLARFKLPKVIEFRDALPRLPTGKLAKNNLRDEIRRTAGSGEADG